MSEEEEPLEKYESMEDALGGCRGILNGIGCGLLIWVICVLVVFIALRIIFH